VIATEAWKGPPVRKDSVIRNSAGRPVVDLEWEYGDSGTAFLMNATYSDTPEGVTERVCEHELAWIEENYPELADEAAWERSVYLGDLAHDRMKEGDA
jgi:hypothetical protein